MVGQWRWAAMIGMVGQWRRAAMIGVVGLSLLLGAAAPPPTTIYLALGDSVAAGQGASQPNLSYVGRELARLRAATPGAGVRLALYAVGGATSDGLVRWQGPAAAEELAALRRGERPGQRLGPVTLTIGGNDLLALQAQALLTGRPPDEAAAREAIDQLERNLTAGLRMLIEAGGPAVRITVTTYYNPLAVAPAASPLRRLAEITTPTLNAAITRAAARYPQQVRVARVDQALPADATIAAYLADQIHPNDRGHAAIAAAVARAWAPSGE